MSTPQDNTRFSTMSKIVRDFRKTLQAQTPEQKAELRKGVLAWHQKIDGRVN